MNEATKTFLLMKKNFSTVTSKSLDRYIGHYTVIHGPMGVFLCARENLTLRT